MTMNIGVVGLGKLGLPLAATLALRGHRVLGYDKNPARMSWAALSPTEVGPDGTATLASLRATFQASVTFGDLGAVVNETHCVLVAVETPHTAEYEGITRLPAARQDFSYDSLRAVTKDIAKAARHPVQVGVISTVLPGTIRREVLPLLDGHAVTYCPQFIAMGTVAYDLCNPEFILLGQDRLEAPSIRSVLQSLSAAPVFTVTYESAELAKMTYNTFISAKVAISNIVQRISNEIGADASSIFDILGSATRRICSPAYIGPGLGDGGPCHPRDNIALSWLAQRIGIRSDLFSAVMEVRQDYVEWLVSKFVAAAGARPLILMGTSYKPNVGISTGSSAVLLLTMIQELGRDCTVIEFGSEDLNFGPEPGAFFIGCPEPEFYAVAFPAGSLVFDPWYRMPSRDDVTVVWPGHGAGIPGQVVCGLPQE